MDASDGNDSVSSSKKSGKTSLLDSGEDFEVLDEEDIDDDLPPLEDAGGADGNKAEKKKEEEKSEASEQTDEWLDVLGMSEMFKWI